MAEFRSRKNKENPHYGFLVSWQPKDINKGLVKGKPTFDKDAVAASTRHINNADSLAQAKAIGTVKKNIFRSIILISLILILELVIYLAWTRFGIK